MDAESVDRLYESLTNDLKALRGRAAQMQLAGSIALAKRLHKRDNNFPAACFQVQEALHQFSEILGPDPSPFITNIRDRLQRLLHILNGIKKRELAADAEHKQTPLEPTPVLRPRPPVCAPPEQILKADGLES